MSIKLKTEQGQHITTVNGHKIIFDDLSMALTYIYLLTNK